MADVTSEQIGKKSYTIAEFEEFLKTADENKDYQLIQGEIVYMPPPKPRHSITSFMIAYFLSLYVFERNLGQVGVEIGYRPDKDEKNWLEMNAGFLSFARFPFATLGEYPTIAPDICVEVVSPGNSKREIDIKTGIYLAGGARLVWAINTKTKTFTVHSVEGGKTVVSTLGATDTLTGGEVLLDFSLKLADFWGKIKA